MTIKDYLDILHSDNKPSYFIICSTDSELRNIYVDRFCKAHNCKPHYVESIDFKNKTRCLATREVLILTDYKPVVETPKIEYSSTNKLIIYLYTNPKWITKEVDKFYNGNTVIIPEITKLQAENILYRKEIDQEIIDYLLENVSNPTEIRLYGLQVKTLAAELDMSQTECFNVYFKPHLKSEISEEPTPFLNAILNSNYTFVFDYLSQQRGNEFYVYSGLFRWLENILRFVACERDYWHKGGLVKAVYGDFQNKGLERIPWITWIHLYEVGIKIREQIKLTERDALSGLEVYVCYIIQTLVENQVIKPVSVNTAASR